MPVNRTLLRTARDQRRRPSPACALLWEALRGHRLEGLRFRRRHIAGPHIVDFYCHYAGLAIFVDEGRPATPEAFDRDAWLTAQGVAVLHLREGDVAADVNAACNRIREALSARLAAA